MKILITGSTGFIGRNFLDVLIPVAQHDWDIVLIQRNPSRYDNPSVRVISADLNDVSAYRSELESADYIFHIAANADVGTSKEKVWSDYNSLEKILEIVRKNKLIKRFVFLSTIGAFDRASFTSLTVKITNNSKASPRSEYGKVKLASEQLLRESKVPFTIFRPSWVWGPGMRTSSHLAFFNKLIEKRSPFARLGFSGKASFIYVGDLVKGMLKVINDGDNHLNKSYFAATEASGIKSVLASIHRLNNSPSWLIPLDFFKILTPLHGYLPLPFNFLFLDYLVCDEKEYVDNFISGVPVLLRDKLECITHRDQYAVITGSNNGIGLELSKLLSRKYHLVLIDRDVTVLKKNFGNEIVIQADLSDRQKLEEVLGELKLNRKVGLLVNNAGVGFKKSFSNTDLNTELLTIDVNIAAPMILSHYFKKDLVGSGGTIINIASSVGYYPLPFMSTYAATKSFILSWSQAIEEELRGVVKIITFSPSGTRTNFQSQAGVKVTNDLLTPEQVAKEIYFSLLMDKSEARLIGLKSKVLRLMMKFLPRVFGLKLLGKLFSENR